jgi:hypothetical protein
VTLNYVRSAFLFCSVALGAATLPAVSPVPAGQPSQPLTAVVLPDGRYSKLALREMAREAAHILKHSGVILRWHVGAPSQAVSGLLVVVKLVGHCDMDGSPAFLVPGPLGWTHEADGVVLPFSDLACDNLRGAVQAAPLDGNPVRGNVLLGRAMGRVLAHELYHIVADTTGHGRDGVAQAALTPRELTSGPLELETREAEALQRGLGLR